jgi:ubiquinol-cytochrome c reductase cytochrome c subunit
MRRAVRALPGLLLLGLAPALAIQALSGPHPALGQPAPEVQRGFDLFAANCASCHGPEAEGTGQAPSLQGVGPAAVDFMLSTGRMPLSDPTQQPVRNVPKFTPEEIAAIVAYVQSLAPGGPEIPTVDPEAGTLSRGREVYAANCLACHGAGGQGAAVGGGAVAPALNAATPVQVAEAVRIGPGVMPPFGPEVVDQEDLDSLVAYVLSLRVDQDPGGLGLGHVGSVLEGLIAWVVGLGLLLLVIRFTGTRT